MAEDGSGDGDRGSGGGGVVRVPGLASKTLAVPVWHNEAVHPHGMCRSPLRRTGG